MLDSTMATKVSEDALFGGRIKLLQPAAGFGYRANVDAILLAAFAADIRRTVRLAVDLGSGAGAVGLTLFHLGAAERIEFIERDASLANLCRRNLIANRVEARAAVWLGDLAESLRTIAPTLVHHASLVVANPPYVSPARDGRRPAGKQTLSRQRARHGELAPFLRAAADALGKRGRACIVYPAHALLELTTAARQTGLEPKRLRFVHGKMDRPARIVLLELAFGKPGGLVVVPPLVEIGFDGQRTAELEELLNST
jgi:tRNA1Val (adenine37-N6)-methyltransferase